VASFLRQHADQLDKAQVGELFGHHADFSISVMHAWIDQEEYGGMAIDLALRRLLEQFRLPGEAQKIDRIMEKFAEVRRRGVWRCDVRDSGGGGGAGGCQLS
jgi:Sec7-like guanine-nucleotide exchange factor